MPQPTDLAEFLGVLNRRVRKLETRHVPFPTLEATEEASGEEEWDCIVDASLTTSTPIADTTAPAIPHYKYITEAINDFGADGRTRCWALVKEGTYNDASNGYTITIGTLTNIVVYGQTTAIKGSGGVIWAPNGNLSVNRFRIENVDLSYNNDLIPANELIIRACSITTNPAGGTRRIDSPWMLAEDTTFAGVAALGGIINIGSSTTTIMNSLDGCEFYSDGTSINLQSSAFGFTTADFMGPSSAVLPLTMASGNWAGQINAASTTRKAGGSSQFRMTVATDFNGSLTGMTEIRITGGNVVAAVSGNPSLTISGGAVQVHISQSGANNTTVSGGSAQITGTLRNLVLSGGTGSFRGQYTRDIEINTASWVIDAVRISPSTATQALLLTSGASRNVIRLGGTNAGGSEKPYTINSGANDNIIDFAGASSYPAAGTDAGTGNLIRITASTFTEDVQDIVGAMATDTSTIDFIYNDGAAQLTADVKTGSIGVSHLSFDPATQTELDAAMMFERIRRQMMVP